MIPKSGHRILRKSCAKQESHDYPPRYAPGRRRGRRGMRSGALTRAGAAAAHRSTSCSNSTRYGNVTLLHVADIHGQLMPVYFREPSVNLGVGERRGQPPHLTGGDFSSITAFRPSRRGLCTDLGGFLGACQSLRPHWRARPARDGRQARAGRTRRQGAAARRRRHLARLARRQASRGQDMVDCMRCSSPTP